MNESVPEFSKGGSWIDAIERGKRITTALEDLNRSHSDIKEQNDRRLKINEWLRSDMREKTAKQVHVEQELNEIADRLPDEDLQNTGREGIDIRDHVTNLNHASNRWQNQPGTSSAQLTL